MTPNEFRCLIDLMGWSQRGAARMLKVGETSVREWARGKRPIPERISQWLIVVSQPMRDFPHPHNP